MRFILIVCTILTSFIVISCTGKNPKAGTEDKAADTVYQVQYAKGFTVKIYDDYKEVTVRDPWDTTKVLQKYILIDKSKETPQGLPEGTVIRTPLSAIAASSTVHCTTLNELQMLNTVKGVCEPEYIDIPYINEGIKDGTIANLGQASNPIVEKIIELDPDAILATPIEGQPYENIAKTGIPVIEIPDYTEISPLGRAEWIRFYSLFFDNESYADSLFSVTVHNYNTIKEKTASADTRPTVFTDLMYRGVWHISGGESFISKMLYDAGAMYMWNGDGRASFSSLAFETVFDHAGEAQYWLIKYNRPYDLTYGRLEQEYKPYSYFKAFAMRNIYQCNTGKTNYYEDMPIHPDYILQDFAYIFHPELFPGYVPKYYTKMKE